MIKGHLTRKKQQIKKQKRINVQNAHLFSFVLHILAHYAQEVQECQTYANS